MKLKRKKIVLLITITILIGFIGQNMYSIAHSDIKTSSDPDVKVVATTNLLRDFAQQVIGDKGDVSVIIEGGSCPGHYDYSPSDINLVSSADIVFAHGFEWEQFLEELLDAAGKLDAAYNVSIQYKQWGDPRDAPLFVNEVYEILNETYPSLNETFTQNKNNYIDVINGFKTYIEANNKHLYNFNGTKAYISAHQKKFLQWLEFNITGDWGWKDDNSMTPGDLEDIIDGAEQTGAEIIVMNYQSGTEMGKEAAEELNIKSAALTNFPGVYGTGTYIEQLEFNIALLHHVLNGGPDPRPSSSDDTIGINLLIPILISAVASIALVIYLKRKALFE